MERAVVDTREDGSCIISKKEGGSSSKSWKRLAIKLQDGRWASCFLNKKSIMKSYPYTLGQIGNKQNADGSWDMVTIKPLNTGEVIIEQQENGFWNLCLDEIEKAHKVERVVKYIEEFSKDLTKDSWGEEEFTNNMRSRLNGEGMTEEIIGHKIETALKIGEIVLSADLQRLAEIIVEDWADANYTFQWERAVIKRFC